MRDGELAHFARGNRGRMPDGERMLWSVLRRGETGVRFRRQYVVGPHILDFAALQIRLNIEADGSQHLYSTRDVDRDGYLLARGWTVLRYTNYEIAHSLYPVLGEIEETIEAALAGSLVPKVVASRVWGD